MPQLGIMNTSAGFVPLQWLFGLELAASAKQTQHP
jgi:hypothetical protein